MPTPRTFHIQTIATVPLHSGANCSLALDANQSPALSCWQDTAAADAKLLFISKDNPFKPEKFGSNEIRQGRGTGSSLAFQKVTTVGQGNVTTTTLKPWVAYHDLDGQAVTVARNEGDHWVTEVVESGICNLASSGIGLAFGSDNQPRLCYSTGQGVTFAARSAVTSGWQRDTLAGLHWQRQIILNGALLPGFDMGLSPSNVMTLSQEDGSFKLQYQPPSSVGGAVFTTFGPVASRAGTDVSVYRSLVVELRGDPGKQVEIGIKDRTQENGIETKVPITLTGNWVTHTIPLASFDRARLDQIFFVCEFVFSGPDPISAFVRSAMLSDAAAPPLTARRPHLTSSRSGSMS